MIRDRKDESVVDPGPAWQEVLTPPAFDFAPLPGAEIYEVFHGGEADADLCERALASMSRVRGALDVAIAEGLHALRHGQRLASLGCHLDDYAREVLDVGKRSADGLAALGAALRDRPRLREALRSGRIRLRAAEVILPVAKGEREAEWVERAATCTVRGLEEAVRRARGGVVEPGDEEWFRFRSRLVPEERAAVDEALALAARLEPGSTRMQQLEFIAAEAINDLARTTDDDDPKSLGSEFHRTAASEEKCRATLESELERWGHLGAVPSLATPEVVFDETDSAAAVDRKLRALARIRAQWDAFVGYWSYVMRRTRLYARLGFATFRHYVEERLGLSPRAVEQRAELEDRVWRSPGLQEARRQGLTYERLRVLGSLPEGDIKPWIAKAKALTCIALRREVEGEKERQTRARGRFSVSLPRRIAVALAVALGAMRKVAGRLFRAGSCLALMAEHFVAVWEAVAPRPRTKSQKVRDRDAHECQVPGCSHWGAHSHHVHWRSRLGGDEMENQAALCAFHHLHCIHHAGTLRVEGEAPAGLVWTLNGKEWRGPGLD